jgi:hypothetical protein
VLYQANNDIVAMYNTNGDIMSIPFVSSRDERAKELRVFLLESERESLKETCKKMGIDSHLVRALALKWLEQQNDNEPKAS